MTEEQIKEAKKLKKEWTLLRDKLLALPCTVVLQYRVPGTGSIYLRDDLEMDITVSI